MCEKLRCSVVVAELAKVQARRLWVGVCPSALTDPELPACAGIVQGTSSCVVSPSVRARFVAARTS